MKSFHLLFSVICLISISCTAENEIPVYEVNYIDEHYNSLDGLLDDDAWGESKVLDKFFLPWEDNTPPLTIFQALYDSVNLYINFTTVDKNMVIKDSIIQEIDIASEDRVEVFLSSDITMKEYYCIEIDPVGRILDYKASFYRKFDDTWNLDGIQSTSKISSEGYQVKLTIPLYFLREKGINTDKDFYAGLFRADFEMSDSGLKEHWLSWIELKNPEPDFHVPEALGIFRFSVKELGKNILK